MAKRSDDAPTLAGVKLSHLDQPVFDDAGATKGELVAYLDAVHERMLPELRGRRALGGAGPAGAGGVHAEEPAEVRPGLDPVDHGLGQRLEAGGALPGLRRPEDAGVAGQPAGGRVPPGALRVDGDRQTHLVLDLDPPDDVAP